MFSKASYVLLGLGGLAANVAALPQPQATNAGSSNPTITAPAQYTPAATDIARGCSAISSSVAAFLSQLGPSAQPPNAYAVDAATGYACLLSVPIDKAAALDFITQIRRFVSYQSTINYLKNSPPTSGQDPVDLDGGLQTIYNDVNSGVITQEYVFEQRVDNLLGSAHEGHLGIGFLLKQVMSFQAPFALADLSMDGKQISKVYVVDDVVLERNGPGGFNASAITQVNGQAVIDYIDTLVQYDNSQSRDTRWNDAFTSVNPPKQGLFNIRPYFPGATSFTLTFENGTTTEYGFIGGAAPLRQDGSWTGFDTGAKIYAGVLQPSSNSTNTPNRLMKKSVDPMELRKRQRNGGGSGGNQYFRLGGDFPDTPGVQPYIQDINQIVGGYFMNDYTKDGSRTAILDITGFAPADENANNVPQAVQATVERFLAESKRRGMQNLVIDVRGNGGGFVNIGYDLYKQLFPSATPFSGTRIRYNTGTATLGTAFSQLIDEQAVDQLNDDLGTGNGNNLTNADQTLFQTAQFVGLSNLDQFLNVDINLKPFPTLDSFLGPHNVTIRGSSQVDSFTNIFRYDLNNRVAVGDPNYDVTGYGSRANLANSPQPFPNQNIVLLTDGVCASTCGIFGEFLRNEQNIRTVIAGGRPNLGQAAAIGGTRGTQVISMDQIVQFASILTSNFQPQSQTQAQAWANAFPSALPIQVSAAQLNWKDNIRRTDPSETPLQFYLEPADCRLFFTADTLVKSMDLWSQVDGLAWGNDTTCAVGQLKGATGRGQTDANGIPFSIGSTNSTSGSGVSQPSSSGSVSRDVNVGQWIWYGMQGSYGSAGGPRGY